MDLQHQDLIIYCGTGFSGSRLGRSIPQPSSFICLTREVMSETCRAVALDLG